MVPTLGGSWQFALRLLRLPSVPTTPVTVRAPSTTWPRCRTPRSPVGGFNCAIPINTGGTHWALDAAIYWLNRWVVTGAPPPRVSLLATSHASPVVYKLDANGNARGGVRTPQVDVPIAVLGSQGNSGGFCFLFGSTVPYNSAQLAGLYQTHGQFVSAWARAIHRDQAEGFILARRCSRAAALGGCFTNRTVSRCFVGNSAGCKSGVDLRRSEEESRQHLLRVHDPTHTPCRRGGRRPGRTPGRALAGQGWRGRHPRRGCTHLGLPPNAHAAKEGRHRRNLQAPGARQARTPRCRTAYRHATSPLQLLARSLHCA